MIHSVGIVYNMIHFSFWGIDLYMMMQRFKQTDPDYWNYGIRLLKLIVTHYCPDSNLQTLIKK